MARFRGLPRVRCPAVAGQAGAAGIPPRTRRADAADTISVRVGHRGAGYRRVAGDTSRRPGPGRSGAHRIGSERNQPTPHTCVAARRIVAGLARGAARGMPRTRSRQYIPKRLRQDGMDEAGSHHHDPSFRIRQRPLRPPLTGSCDLVAGCGDSSDVSPGFPVHRAWQAD